jgi:hypothetical protein
MYNIFVSYAQTELKWAKFLKQHLAISDVNVFVAEYDLSAGDYLSIEISNQIKKCDLFILLWTQNANLSKYVNQELFLAKSENKKPLPILLQPGIQLPQLLGDIKYLDIAKSPESQFAWLRKFVEDEAKSKSLSNVIIFGILAFVAIAAFQGGK